jgi:glycosyltransferase involved in cell wall biosynthesis
MKLSIITINKNNAAGLEKTIQSVTAQIFSDFEYIVIDGSSDDGSVEIIKKYAEKITYWVSEPDSGIYHAMNKGIKAARGEYCLFLNSGDILINKNTLNKIFEEISSCPASDIYYSDCVNQNNTISMPPKLLNIEYFIHDSINHQNSITKRELFLKHGFYDEKFEIASDWAFFISEFWVHKTKFTYIKHCISLYDTNGISSSQVEKSRSEKKIVINNMFKELSPIMLEYANYKYNLANIIYSNIQQRQGLGLKFILKCIKHWLFRNKKSTPNIPQYGEAIR